METPGSRIKRLKGQGSRKFDRQAALQTSQEENNDRIPFTLTFYPHNHAVKSIILKIFKLPYFKMIPILIESFHSLNYFHSNATKT